MMPEVDGLDRLYAHPRILRRCPSSCSPPSSEDADKLIGLESGADDYVTKPFNILELKAAHPRLCCAGRRARPRRSARSF